MKKTIILSLSVLTLLLGCSDQRKMESKIANSISYRAADYVPVFIKNIKCEKAQEVFTTCVIEYVKEINIKPQEIKIESLDELKDEFEIEFRFYEDFRDETKSNVSLKTTLTNEKFNFDKAVNVFEKRIKLLVQKEHELNNSKEKTEFFNKKSYK